MNLPIKISLPETFLEPEERCGYTVDSKHKMIWAIELDLLAELLRVCSQYDINVQIFAGTLLGAARHQGFIPWDDDLDVIMSYADYLRLCEVAEKEFKHPYFFQNGITDRRYFFGFARLRNTMTTAAIKGFDTPDYNNGIFIDINILNSYPNSRLADRIKNIRLRLVSKIIKVYIQQGGSRNQNWISSLFFLCRPLYRLISLESWYRLYYRIACEKSLKSRYTGLDYTTFCEESRMRYRIESRLLSKTILLDFEWLKVPAPAMFKEVLSSIYGDWHIPPPISSRGKWHEGEIRFDPLVPYRDYLSTEGHKHA